MHEAEFVLLQNLSILNFALLCILKSFNALDRAQLFIRFRPCEQKLIERLAIRNITSAGINSGSNLSAYFLIMAELGLEERSTNFVLIQTYAHQI